MAGTVLREFNEREQAVFAGHLAMEKPPREPRGPWLGCLIISFILGGLAYFFWGTEAGLLLAGICLLGLIIVSYLSMENLRWRNKRLEVELMLSEALEDKRVEVARYRASEVVIEINEHGPNVYYFDIGEERILRVELGSVRWPATDPGDGHALYVDPESDMWPNDHFEIVRTMKHRLWVGIFCFGEKLNPVHQINTLERAPLVSTCESTVAIFEGSFKRLSEKPIEEWA